ncbi:MAG TPA: GIY-YIG nuclease family protein [Thermomicrobiales bacterium]|nr:GIY-YIG nuclease family protein [Thermomicrobiales bacterium]
MITAEIMNWTGHVVAASRSDLDALLKRPELSRTGIYFLIGENPNNPLEPMVYIGEGDLVKTRLYAHAKPENQTGKDFWNRTIVFTSKDANLTKAHARYLESRFIDMAAQAKRAKLDNGTSPETLMLPEADISDMEDFISQAEIILPLLASVVSCSRGGCRS